MIKLLHSADIHLDAPFPSLGDKEEPRRDDFLFTFERLLNLAITWEADLFAVAGDLFDTPTPSPATISKVSGGLQRLADCGITTVLLPGTHDSVAFPNSVFRRHSFPGAILLADPQVIEPASLEIRGEKVYLYGFGYKTTASAQALDGMKRRAGEGIHVGLLHGSRIGSPEWDYRPKDLPFSLDDLASWNLDYVALGHYHNFQVLTKNGRILGCYPGSPEGRRFGENGDRFAALATVGKERVILQKKAVNRRLLKEETLDISNLSDMAAVSRAVAARGDSDILLRLTLTGLAETLFDTNQLCARVGKNFFHLEIKDRTRFFDSRFTQRIAEEKSVRGAFVRRVREQMKKATQEERLLMEKAFREVMARFRFHEHSEV